MNDIDEKFIACVEADDLSTTIALLKSGANVHAGNDAALRVSARIGALDIMIKLLENNANINAESRHYYSALKNGIFHNHLNVITKLLEYGVDLHANDDYALRLSVQYRRVEITAALLEYGANIYRGNKQILKDLQSNFNEGIADVILPYCNACDYEYFPSDYIKKRVIPTKNASMCAQKN